MPAASVRYEELGLFARKGEAHPALAADMVAMLPSRRQPVQRHRDGEPFAAGLPAKVHPVTGLAALIQRSEVTCDLVERWPADAAIGEEQRTGETTTVDLGLLTRTERSQECQPEHQMVPSQRRQMTVRLEPEIFQRLETVRAEGSTTYQTLLELAVRRLVFGEPTDAADSPARR